MPPLEAIAICSPLAKNKSLSLPLFSLARLELTVPHHISCICGLSLRACKMGLQLNITDRRQWSNWWACSSLCRYTRISRKFSLPSIRNFFGSWLGESIPSYVKDIADNAVAHPVVPSKWRSTWQQAIFKCGSLVSHLPVFFFFLRSHTWREPSVRRF